MSVRASVSLSSNFPNVDEIFAAAQEGMDVAAEHLLAEAVARAPRDEGTLQLSGSAGNDLRDRTEGTPSAVVTFDTPYAARLHEHPEYNFATDSNPNAQGKYLENAALENKAKLGEIIAEKIRNGGA